MSIKDRFRIFDGPTCVYGTQKMVNRYTGPLLRVRRGSDNAEKDFNSLNGIGYHVDINEILDFTGTGVSDNGFIAKLYDQHANRSKITTYAANSGTEEANGTDYYHPSASAQPNIVESGAIILDHYGHPAIKFNTSNDAVNLKMGRQTKIVENLMAGMKMEFRSNPTGDAKCFNFAFTSSKFSLGYQTTPSQLMKLFNRPDIVKGTDDNWYQALESGVSLPTFKPITGASYATYWEDQPVGNSQHDPIDFDTTPIFFEDNINLANTLSIDPSDIGVTARILSHTYHDYVSKNVTSNAFENSYKMIETATTNFPKTGYSFSNSTHRSDEADTEYSVAQLSKIGQKADLITNLWVGYVADPLCNCIYPSFSNEVMTALGYLE